MKTQEYLLFLALYHVVEACHKGSVALYFVLIKDAAKLGWNACNKLNTCAANRAILLKPIYTIFFYLRQCRAEYDLVLLYGHLIFEAA